MGKKKPGTHRLRMVSIIACFTTWTLVGVAKMHIEWGGHVHIDVITLQCDDLANAYRIQLAIAHLQHLLRLLLISSLSSLYA